MLYFCSDERTQATVTCFPPLLQVVVTLSLYTLLMIVQLLSTSVHVVDPGKVKILEAAVSFYITECSTTRTYPWPDS